MKVLSFGEILWDLYPDKKYLGGAPLNFAAHLAKHGEDSYMLSAVGQDALGEEAIAQIRQWGVFTDLIALCPEKQTGKCLVTLDKNSVPSYNLLEDVAYDHIFCEGAGDDFDVLYFGTLALRSNTNYRTLKDILRKNRFKEVFVDINIRPPFYTGETVRFAVENATMLKISLEELPAVRSALCLADMPYEEFSGVLAKRYPNLRCVIITRGEEGAYVLDCVRQKDAVCGCPKVETVSTVGAGDSFSAAFLSKYMGGCTMEVSLAHAVKVAAFVVSRFDAVPDYDQT